MCREGGRRERGGGGGVEGRRVERECLGACVYTLMPTLFGIVCTLCLYESASVHAFHLSVAIRPLHLISIHAQAGGVVHVLKLC